MITITDVNAEIWCRGCFLYEHKDFKEITIKNDIYLAGEEGLIIKYGKRKWFRAVPNKHDCKGNELINEFYFV